MFCPDCMGTGESFPCVPCGRCHATGELAYTVDVTLTNEDQGYRFSEYTDTIDADTRGDRYDDTGTPYLRGAWCTVRED